MASTFTPTVITSNSGQNNVFTNIPLANNATTTIQNISTFANGEGGVLTGVIKIDATADYVFGFEISFTKDTAGVINHSVRYFAGDIPTLALFTIGVSGQDIQITLGSHAGFVNASARFQMMASAASPGVQVGARNVTGDTTGAAPGLGLLGQVITATRTGSDVGIAGTSWVNGVGDNITLTPGTWLLYGTQFIYASGAFSLYDVQANIGTATGNNTTGMSTEHRGTVPTIVSTIAYTRQSISTVPRVISISSNTTYWIKAYADSSSGGSWFSNGMTLTGIRIA